MVRAYFTFFNLAFSMSAQQTTAFCFESGRNQTILVRRKELHRTQVILRVVKSTLTHLLGYLVNTAKSSEHNL